MINYPWYLSGIIGHKPITFENLLSRPILGLIIHDFNIGIPICGAFWFVLVIFILRLIYPIIHKIRIIHIAFIIFCLFTAFKSNQAPENGILFLPQRAIIAYPFFLFGIYIKKHQTILSKINRWEISLLLCSFIILILFSYYLGTFNLYSCNLNYLLAELNYKRFMFKKLCILLIFSKLNEIKHLIDKYRMHNLYAIFAKLLNICKQIAGNLVNESGNVPRRGVVPKFSDLEVVALNMASEAVGIDSESLLFANLQEYRVEIPNLISRRQYNDRRKITSSLCNAIRERMVAKMDGGEDYFCIDSKPIEVCRIARSKRCSMGKKDFSKAPGVGYCASQSMYYYGYKLHAVCGLSGVIHSFDLTKASVHDIHYLKDVKVDYSNCTVIGDRGYISAQVQLDLFETANIRLEVPYRCNQKEWKPTFPAFAKARKRIETLFSQLCDQFMIIRNYAKDTDGLFARIIGKISALTILQYINYKNEKPIGRVKYALF